MCQKRIFLLIRIIIVVFTVFSFSELQSQVPDIPNVNDLSTLSDTELSEYISAARAQGYTIDQIKALALARGVSPEVVSQLESRVLGQGVSNSSQGVQSDALEIDKTSISGVAVNPTQVGKENPLFGFDFFNNPNISFTPNLNLTTPANYQLGPGDELVINIWGAAENTYEVAIDRNGAIRIPGVGPIYLNGTTFETAVSKIEGNLKKIYGGISAPKSSSYKVNVDVSLVNIRTVNVNIIGQVKAPGTYTLSALSTVLNGLYAAGGPTKDGTLRKIKLVRNGGATTYFDVYKYLIDGSQDGNLTLQNQDVLIVAPYISKVNVSGAFKRSGIYEILPEETLTDLVSYASGFKSNAYKDKIRLERIQNDRKVIKEVAFKDFKNESLNDGDVINVGIIIDEIINKIEIEGSVYRPGIYEFNDGLTLKELIQRASGLKKEAFLERGIIIRKIDGITNKVIPFSVSKVINGDVAINLQLNDIVRIFNAKNFKGSSKLYINGAVNNGGDFAYFENMSIQDLIVLAGGFNKGANKEVIDVYRQVIDDNFETLSKSFKVNSINSLDLDDGTPFILQPNDRVSVRWLKGYSDQKQVFVDGEANFPGAYSISSKNERISDLIERAGGLSPYAFVEGGVLIRQNPYYQSKKNPINATIRNSNVLADSVKLKDQKEFSVGINLKDILAEGKDSKSNLVLENGDRLFIPSIQETIKVEGRVVLPSLIKYEDNLSLRDYIDKSGGFANRAKKGKVVVVYPNGDIATTNSFLFFRSYPKIKPGSLVIVPQKPEPKGGVSIQEGIGIITGIASIGLLIDRIAN